MKFVSTRSKDINVTSAEAIVRGLAQDGGLFMPESFPHFTDGELSEMLKLDYKQRAGLVLSKFLTDYTENELCDCINGAYTAEKFGKGSPAPVKKLDGDTYVLELWHGPTCAFKDMALQLMPRLLTVAAKKGSSDKTIVILVATSGDTGKAALEGFCDVDGTKILVFYPFDGVSCVQKKQMTSQGGSNTYVMGINGNFDDCQSGVKKIFSDKSAVKLLEENGYVFSSANSINWGRLVPQIVYYFSAYADMVNTGEIACGQPVDFVVPTGNFGNILAGYIAKIMGLPAGQFVCASNTNNVLTDFINTGVYDKNREFHTTVSPSMDILISSNLERLLYIMSGSDSAKVAEYMKQLAESGRYEIDSDMRAKISAEFAAGYADEAATMAAIKDAYSRYSYLIDPHTAVAYSVAKRYNGKNKKVILSTASPYKFPDSVIRGLGFDSRCGSEFDLLNTLHELTGVDIPASLAGLEAAESRFNDSCEKDDMLKAVCKFLGI